MDCIVCGKDMGRVRRRMCRKPCKDHYFSQLKDDYRCTACGLSYKRLPKNNKHSKFNRCLKCTRQLQLGKSALRGSASPSWRGGRTRWLDGRFGRDKDGLSWKIQRQKCWVRDNNTCQICKKPASELKRNLDCHHIIPYRISYSHALDNLISLCPRCHKIEDHKVTDVFSGSIPIVRYNRKTRPRCKTCGKPRKLYLGNCEGCERELRRAEIDRMHNTGIPIKFIAERFDISERMVYYVLDKSVKQDSLGS